VYRESSREMKYMDPVAMARRKKKARRNEMMIRKRILIRGRSMIAFLKKASSLET